MNDSLGAHVESILSQHPAVKVVRVREGNAAAGTECTAYVLCEDTAPPREEEFEEVLTSARPGWQGPMSFVILTEASPHDGRSWSPAGSAPGADDDAVERVLAGIWQQVLGANDLGRDSHFFASGGQSIQAMQVVLRVEQMLGVEVPWRCLFETPTLGDFAKVVVRHEPVPHQSDTVARLWLAVRPPCVNGSTRMEAR